MFEIKRTVYFSDCDPAGILFYVKVFEFCHSAYEEFINSFHLNFDFWANEYFAVPVKSTEAKYIRAIKYSEIITIKLKVLELRNSSFSIGYLILNEKGETCVEVKSVHVFVDKKNWTKIEILKEVKENLSKFLV